MMAKSTAELQVQYFQILEVFTDFTEASNVKDTAGISTGLNAI